MDADIFGEVSDTAGDVSDTSSELSDTAADVSDISRQMSDTPGRAGWLVPFLRGKAALRNRQAAAARAIR
ncbi:hypothetical protein [Sporosarcina koreensis]|uniref:hypothetical protein n=1 Tax=Sporosarcina koreensis TaxID=334735 RepID=UPI00058B06A6|nr:hypothetical protein [Sporosarcina koreensis]